MVKIIVDSTADLIEEVKPQVTVVPLTICFGEEEYIDGVTINHRQFYEKLIESDLLPTTSQVTPHAFGECFKEATKNGDTAVVITLSSKLSGTYQSALIAAEDFEGKVFVVDSESVAIGSGILTEYALKLKNEGMEASDIAAELEEEKKNIRVIALLDTLEYLKKGGRISAATATIGGMLAIKPVICLTDGEIKQLGKARGSKQANNLLASEIAAAGGVDFKKPLLLGYTGLTDILLQKYIEDSAHLWKDGADTLHTTVVGSVVGTHAGPGAIAVAFFKKK